MRRLLWILAAVAVAAVVAVGIDQAGGISGAGSTSVPSLAAQRAALADAPAPLAALHSQASEILGGGEPAFQARLAALRGHPIVVYKWASWCGPCRQEFPLISREALARGRSVAFLGVDYDDDSGAAHDFLQQIPQSYPSYSDPDGAISRTLDVPFQPSTVFFDAAGHRTLIHQGPFDSEAELNAAVNRYAVA
jgi:thiol-disulfide isomerase/thioredoxin